MKGLHRLRPVVLALALVAGPSAAEVTDDWGRPVAVDPAARRIAALAPHIVEMLFLLGVGDRIVATVDYADHPAAARAIPRVGNAFGVSREALIARRPDLVVLWGGAADAEDVAFAERSGARVFVSDPAGLVDVVADLHALAALTGADRAPVDRFEASLQALRTGSRDGSRHGSAIRVAVLIASEPLLSVSDTHFIGDAVAHCGGVNVFGTAPGPVVRISVESLLATDPEVVVLVDEQAREASARRLASMIEGARFVRIEPDLMARPGPRLLDGTRRLCVELEARSG